MAETVRVESKGLEKLQRIARDNIQPGNPMRDMLSQWAARYGSFIRRRFIKQSRGGGDWPDLAASTKRKRRGPARQNKGKKRSFAILIDTGQLRDAIEPGATGNLLQDGNGYIDIGFAGQARAAGGVTMGDLAKWHHYGMGNNPKREILVNPDASTLRGMASDAKGAGRDIERMIGRGL